MIMMFISVDFGAAVCCFEKCVAEHLLYIQRKLEMYLDSSISMSKNAYCSFYSQHIVLLFPGRDSFTPYYSDH